MKAWIHFCRSACMNAARNHTAQGAAVLDVKTQKLCLVGSARFCFWKLGWTLRKNGLFIVMEQQVPNYYEVLHFCFARNLHRFEIVQMSYVWRNEVYCVASSVKRFDAAPLAMRCIICFCPRPTHRHQITDCLWDLDFVLSPVLFCTVPPTITQSRASVSTAETMSSLRLYHRPVARSICCFLPLTCLSRVTSEDKTVNRFALFLVTRCVRTWEICVWCMRCHCDDRMQSINTAALVAMHINCVWRYFLKFAPSF